LTIQRAGQGIAPVGKDIRVRLSEFLLNSLGTIKNREKALPPLVLQEYVKRLLAKRDILIHSASQFNTPQYFFDEPALSSSLSEFHRAFSRHFKSFRLFYAVKSNSFPGISKHVVAKGHGLDVSSGHELLLALALGCERIIFSGPGKTDSELRLAVAHREKVTLLLDSRGELQRLSRIVSETGLSHGPVRVGIRVRGHHHGTWEKFGVSLVEMGQLFQEAISSPGIEPQGIQFHTSWNLNPEAQVKMIKAIGSYLKTSLLEDAPRLLTFLDIGGGYWPEFGEWLTVRNTFRGKLLHLFDPKHEFKLRHYYRPSRPISQFASEISEAISAVGSPINDLEIWMEPGRWISTPSMHILLKIMDKKEHDAVITDGGINLLGWERPLEEFIPVINLTRPSLMEMPMRVFGSLCTPLDIWGFSMFGDGASPGDILLVPNQGAYTYSLRQSFIKPIAPVVHYDGSSLSVAKAEEHF
jgi:diaminopimelate decarboxylase